MITNRENLKRRNEYNPDLLIPPGRSLLELLKSRGMSQVELATRTSRPVKTINEIVKGKATITPETALQFERVLGVPARFWNNLELNYREAVAARNEQKELQEDVELLNIIPIKDLIKRGWIKECKEKENQLKEVLQFFGISCAKAWSKIWESLIVYRKSKVFQGNPGAVASWLRKGEIESQNKTCSAFSKTRFTKILHEAKTLTRENNPDIFVPRLQELCASAGVVILLIPELPKTYVCGATRWLSKDRALIQLSMRYKSDDQFWFTFFHEAGHLILHGKDLIFLEGISEENEFEAEADRFASNFLIPNEAFEEFSETQKFNANNICDFAQKVGIGPGIVVGRLQHEEKIPYRSQLNKLKIFFRWPNEYHLPLPPSSGYTEPHI